MNTTIVAERLQALTDIELEELGLLSGDAFGVDGINLEWKRKTDHFLIRIGTKPICRVGVVHRIDAAVGQSVLTLAGIGGVITVPAHQNKGHASQLLKHVLSVLAAEKYTFAALFCLNHLIPYYRKLGWYLVEDYKVSILQTGGHIESPLNFMTFALTSDAWPSGNVRIEQRIW